MVKKSDRIVFTTIGLLAGWLAVLTLYNYQSENQKNQAAIAQQILKTSPIEVVGKDPHYLGNRLNPYTLVEFADYECPPCRTTSALLSEALRSYPTKIKFVFRNLPLTNIHEHAMDAALAAEAATGQNKFWQVHDYLYSHDISSESIATLPYIFKFNVSRYNYLKATYATQRIDRDLNAAKKLDINGTPTFLLCKPNGTIIRLKSINQLAECLNY